MYEDIANGGHMVILYPRYITSEYIIDEIKNSAPVDTEYITSENIHASSSKNVVLLICETDKDPKNLVKDVFPNDEPTYYNCYPEVCVNVVNHIVNKTTRKLKNSFSSSDSFIDATLFYPEQYGQNFIEDTDITKFFTSENDIQNYSEKISLLVKLIRERRGKHLICVRDQARCGVKLISSILKYCNITHSIMPNNLTEKEKRQFILKYNLGNCNVLIVSGIINTTLFDIVDVHFINILSIDYYDNIIDNLNNVTDSLSDSSQKLNEVNFNYYPTILQDQGDRLFKTEDLIEYQNLTKRLQDRRNQYDELCSKSKSLIHWSKDE